MSSNYQFDRVPRIYSPRSRFDLSHKHLTTFNMGELVPVLAQEILPGDTINNDVSVVIRTTSPLLRPIMDQMYLDLHFFYVPNRQVWEHWKEFMGENNESPWVSNKEYTVPTVGNYETLEDMGNEVYPNTVADHLGFPIMNRDVGNGEGMYFLPQALVFRAFAKIYNDWWRDENSEYPVLINYSDSSDNHMNNLPWAANNYTGKLPKINKFHDVFTSALPAPQKGDGVEIPLGQAVVRTAETPLISEQDDLNELTFSNIDGTHIYGGLYNLGLGSGALGIRSGGQQLDSLIAPNNLYVDLSGDVNLNVNDLRFAFAIQRILESDARAGTRYNEILMSKFHVVSSDGTLQRAEYISGFRLPLNIQQVAQTSQNTTDNYVADLGAFSLSSLKTHFYKGFEEHGWLIGVACVRQNHTYSQGIPKKYMRGKKSRYDYYWPQLAHIGEQPISQAEIKFENANNYFNGGNSERVFGYQEAWYDYRYNPNMATGYFSANAPGGFNIWHLGDNFGNAPILSPDFLQENSNNIDRVLAIPSEKAPNFICDIFYKMSAVRVMPTYSVPGLIDHY